MNAGERTRPAGSPALSGGIPCPAPLVHIRLLETTDVHANLLPFDYHADAGGVPFGLARTATLIHQARAEVDNSLLLDNGDFLQGTPMSDLTAQPGSGWTGDHPAITAMNQLGYDAATVGNHEFNFGLDWLRNVLSEARFPITSANILLKAEETPFLSRHVILDRRLTDADGYWHALRIGVIGFAPPQITTWDQYHLRGRIVTRDIVETARFAVPELRAEGADIVIALAHTGIGAAHPCPMMENAAIPLAGVQGIDAVLAGHSHQVFPARGFEHHPGVDMTAGTLNDTPTVMAGFRGSHLGVLDLCLRKTASGWTVAGHRAEARPVAPEKTAHPTPPDRHLATTLAPAHEKTLHLTRRSLGRTDRPLHSYLSMVRNDPAIQLVNHVQRRAIADMLKGSALATVPVLSAAAPFKSGGRGGPGHFTDIAAGELCLGHVADLYSFPNTLCALHLSGAELRDWLERAASCFNRIRPDSRDQMLCNSQFPGHDFDIIDGTQYVIDLSQPPRFDASGALIEPAAHRIRELTFKGAPVRDHDAFILATNNYRAFGGGPYPAIPADRVVVTSRQLMYDVIAKHIRRVGELAPRARPTWSFAPMDGVSIIFDTGPGIRRHRADITAIGAEDLGDTETGFARLRLYL